MEQTDKDVRLALEGLGNPERAVLSKRYFKTGPGEYGEGDVFIGATVPAQRAVAKRFKGISLASVGKLLKSPVHEHRLTALLIINEKYAKADAKDRAGLAAFYLKHRSRINNWDLVDVTAPYILGDHFLTRDKAPLYRLARSKSLWDRRIAILSTFAFIRKGEFDDTFRIAEGLLDDEHDLMHKAVGWMLREAGNRSQTALLRFLKKHHARMPRTALRYAIEKFPPERRKRMLAGDYR